MYPLTTFILSIPQRPTTTLYERDYTQTYALSTEHFAHRYNEERKVFQPAQKEHRTMPNPQMSNPQKEHPSTYMVQDRDNQEELARLQLQDQLTTERMGGTLPEQPDPTSFQRVLDIGCGTGGWLIEAAKTYPTMTKLYGIDTSGKMLDYARAQAEASGAQARMGSTGDRIEFLLMDALRMLEFPTHFFDLVNMRFAQSWIRTWEWPKLLQEAQRVTRPGGIVRLTEGYGDTTSPALNRLYHLLIQAFDQA